MVSGRVCMLPLRYVHVVVLDSEPTVGRLFGLLTRLSLFRLVPMCAV
jgi:hypothetical protein